jgi:2'-5' RNA ligase
MKALRLFIALPISEEIRERLKELQEIGRGKGLTARWTAPAGIHLTLVFLGWTEPGLQAKVEEALERVARLTPPFTLDVTGLGVFPRIQAPRVIWAGIEEAPALMTLQRRVSLEVAELGFELEARSYRPHLTLGRVEPSQRLGKSDRFAEWMMEGKDLNIGTCNMEKVVLMKSESHPGGSVYLDLFGSELKG